jgi:hypothetical protein
VASVYGERDGSLQRVLQSSHPAVARLEVIQIEPDLQTRVAKTACQVLGGARIGTRVAQEDWDGCEWGDTRRLSKDVLSQLAGQDHGLTGSAA